VARAFPRHAADGFRLAPGPEAFLHLFDLKRRKSHCRNKPARRSEAKRKAGVGENVKREA
jgi:hypothetical protein